MGLFTFNIVESTFNKESLNKIFEELEQQNKKIDIIMATFEEVQAQVVSLQETVDAEQAQIQELLDINRETISQLEATIADLQEQIAAGATPEQLQSIVDQIEATKADIAATVEDEPVVDPTDPEEPVDPIEPTEPEEGEGEGEGEDESGDEPIV